MSIKKHENPDKRHEIELTEEQLLVAEQQLKLKGESLKLQKWHLYAIWIGVIIALCNTLFNTFNTYLIVSGRR